MAILPRDDGAHTASRGQGGQHSISGVHLVSGKHAVQSVPGLALELLLQDCVGDFHLGLGDNTQHLFGVEGDEALGHQLAFGCLQGLLVIASDPGFPRTSVGSDLEERFV